MPTPGGTLAAMECGKPSPMGELFPLTKAALWFARGAFRIRQAFSYLLLPLMACAEQLPIMIYRTADGLARDKVTAIVTDKNGYLWLGTFEGLSRFDGYEFVNYVVNQGSRDDVVSALLITRDGSLWIGTSSGLFHFNPLNDRLAGTGLRSISRMALGTVRSLHWPKTKMAPFGAAPTWVFSGCGGFRHRAHNLTRWISSNQTENCAGRLGRDR